MARKPGGRAEAAHSLWGRGDRAEKRRISKARRRDGRAVVRAATVR